MNWYLNSQDLFVLIVVPLIVMTIIEMRNRWDSIWDDTLTAKDREILLRFTMFILMPAVVFLHECGHAAAILLFGGKVAEFHYGLLWGYVIPAGSFTDEQILIIYLAGNAVEVFAGFVALAVAVRSKSPPVVATGVYLGLWSIAGTLILYTLMSVLGMYGDWQAIYTSPVRSWVLIIGICHATLVIAIFWAILSSTSRLWFAKRTRLEWALQFRAAKARADADPSPANLLDLAWTYYEGGLDRGAFQALARAEKAQPTMPEPWLLKGWLYVSRQRYDKAKECFGKVATSKAAPPVLQARAYMALAQTALDEIERSLRGRQSTAQIYQEALQQYSLASLADPELADPRFYRARLLNKSGLHEEAKAELNSLSDLKWLNPALSSLVASELSHSAGSSESAQ